MNSQKHPNALVAFFSTELWERYGFYVVQSLIALYLSVHFKLTDRETYALVGSFTALTYISPIIGGWIADHLIGQKKAILSGAIILSISYIILAFSHSLHGIILALAHIAVGTGLLKPNISSLLGKQYAVNDSRKDSGYTIFYMGITLGIILGTTLPNYLQADFGWRICFLSAALGALLAFFIFLFSSKKLGIQDYASINPKQNQWQRYLSALSIVMGLLIISLTLLANTQLATIFFSIVLLLAVGYVLKIAYQEKGVQRVKTICFLLLFIVSTLFWAFYFEMFMGLTLFIARTVKSHIDGIALPPPLYVSIQSIGMIFFGVILQKLWSRRKAKNIAYDTSIKFAAGLVCMVISYSLILIAIDTTAPILLISPAIVIIAYLAISLAELLISPIGLAAVTNLARPQIVSTMTGIFFVSLGLGGFLAGKLSSIAAISNPITSLSYMKAHYFAAFSKLLYLLIGALILSGIIAILIRRMNSLSPVSPSKELLEQAAANER